LIYEAAPDSKPLVEPDAPVHGPVDLNLSAENNADALHRLMETFRIY